MRVLVTGGTGYLGAAIVRAVAARGHIPIAFARHARAMFGASVAAIDGDIRDRDAVRAAVRSADAVCHAAALVSQWRANPREFDEVNVGGLRHVIDAVADAGCQRLVYTSSFLARPPEGRHEPLRANDYQRTKVDARRIALDAADRGAPVVIVCPGVIYGPGAATEGNLVGRLLRDHRAGRLPGLVGADRIWSFAWIDDVAAAHAAAIDRPGLDHEYGLGGENVPQIRLFEVLRDQRLWDRPLPRRLPYWLSTAVGFAEESRARLTGRPPLLTRGDVEIFRFDWPVEHAEAARDLGYRPTPLAETLATLLRNLS